MKASGGFIFFMLFLAGIALVNLKGMQERSAAGIKLGSEIADTAWRPTHIGQMRLGDDSKMILQFRSDSDVIGHAGCNQFFGGYTLIDGALKIGPLDTTRETCAEPDNSFEISFLAALQSARSLSRSEKRLIMRDEKGLVVARYVATDRDDAQQ